VGTLATWRSGTGLIGMCFSFEFGLSFSLNYLQMEVVATCVMNALKRATKDTHMFKCLFPVGKQKVLAPVLRLRFTAPALYIFTTP
jgi:hypothetical protein